MGPWGSERTGANGKSAAPRPDVGRWLMATYTGIAILVLLLLALGLVATERYQFGEAGNVPVRMDRITGEVIGCIPTKGCFRLIPPGEPQLGSLSIAPAAKGAQQGPTAAGPGEAPAAPAAEKPTDEKPPAAPARKH